MWLQKEQAVRVATQYAPPLFSHMGAQAPRATPSRQLSMYFPTPNTFPRWPLKPPYALRPHWVKQPGDLDLWPFDLESDIRVTCDVGYLCANFGIPRPLCSRLRPDVRDRQTSDRQTSDVRQKYRLMPPTIRGRYNNRHSTVERSTHHAGIAADPS